MARIMFVDDEPKVLDALRRMLRSEQHQWELFFATSGDQALDMLSKTPCDVIVSDMRMPGMDGATLLTEVMKRFPNTIRVILSGQSDEEHVLRCVSQTHQFLSKPCDAAQLKETITKALRQQALVGNEDLQSVISKINLLPSLPAPYIDLANELKAEEPSLSKIANIIAGDVAMLAKLLQMVNSAFFGLQTRVTSPQHAVAVLGVNTLKSLVLYTHVFEEFKEAASAGFDIHNFEAHSASVASIARKIAHLEKLSSNVQTDCFTAGLLHDLGQLVLATNLPKDYRSAVNHASSRKISMELAEKEIIGSTHASVGGYLLGLWGLPDVVIQSAAFHHNPSDCPTQDCFILTATHFADWLHNTTLSKSETGKYTDLDIEYLISQGLQDRIDDWANCASISS